MEVKGIWDLKHNDYISPGNITKDWSILAWSAKWLFEPEIMGQVVTPKEAMNREEGSILKGMWKLMDEADFIITQNGEGFDFLRLNSKFLKYGYAPPSHYLSVDTLKAAKKVIYLPSYKLDYIGKKVLGIEGKMKMSMEDWDSCAAGDKNALQKMLAYCKIDIAPLLEDWYLHLLPWIPSHPNLNIFTNHDKDVCPKCESTDLKWGKTYKTPQGLWDSFSCSACGSIGRGTKKEHNIKKVHIK